MFDALNHCGKVATISFLPLAEGGGGGGDGASSYDAQWAGRMN